MANVKNRLQKPIESLSLDKEDLIKLLNILQERAITACSIETDHIESFIPAENLEKSIQDLRTCSTLKITITGLDGKELYGGIDEVMESVSFPERVISLYVNSEMLYKAYYNY